MSIESVARRYASALADIALEHSQEETIRSELSEWNDLISGNRNLYYAFSNPAIAHQEKIRLLEELISRTSPSLYTANFLRVLVKNFRITDLPEIKDKFADVLEERRGITSASVTSARELSDEEKAELRANLEKMTGKEVHLQFDIDENVIGGAVTRLGSTVYDGSVKTQLELLKQQMIDS